MNFRSSWHSESLRDLGMEAGLRRSRGQLRVVLKLAPLLVTECKSSGVDIDCISVAKSPSVAALVSYIVPQLHTRLADDTVCKLSSIARDKTCSPVAAETTSAESHVADVAAWRISRRSGFHIDDWPGFARLPIVSSNNIASALSLHHWGRITPGRPAAVPRPRVRTRRSLGSP